MQTIEQFAKLDAIEEWPSDKPSPDPDSLKRDISFWERRRSLYLADGLKISQQAMHRYRYAYLTALRERVKTDPYALDSGLLGEKL